MDFADFDAPEKRPIDLNGENRWEVIDELIDHLVKIGKIAETDRIEVSRAVGARESKSSTGIGNGIGIPHAMTSRVSTVIAALGRSQKGIDFNAVDGKPVHKVLLFLVPANDFQAHLNVLASAARFLHRSDLQ